MSETVSIGPVGAALWGLFCLTIGALLGHWLSLGRERRKERNEVAQRIRKVLLQNRKDLNPMSELPADADVDLLEQMLPRRRRKGFRDAAADYKKKATDSEIDGRFAAMMGLIFRDENAVAASIDALLPYTLYK